MTSPTNAFNLTYQGGKPNIDLPPAFDEFTFPILMNVTIQDAYIPTVIANTDFVQWADYKISLDSMNFKTYAKNCSAYVSSDRSQPAG